MISNTLYEATTTNSELYAIADDPNLVMTFKYLTETWYN